MFRLFCCRQKKPQDPNDLERPLARNIVPGLAEQEEMDVDAKNRQELRIKLALNFSRDFSWTVASILLLDWTLKPTTIVDYGPNSQQMGQQVLATLAMLITMMGFIAHARLTGRKVPVKPLFISFSAAAGAIYPWDYGADICSAKSKEWLGLSDKNAGNFAALCTGGLEGIEQFLVRAFILWIIHRYYSSELATDPTLKRFLTELALSAMPFAGGLPGGGWMLIYNNRYQLGTIAEDREPNATDVTISSTQLATGVMITNYIADEVVIPGIMNRLFPPKPVTITLDESDRGSLNSTGPNKKSSLHS